MNGSDMSEKDTALALSRSRATAWLALFWERFWPLILPLLCVVSLFVSISWLGLWPQMHNTARLILLGAFALAACGALWPLRHMRLPTALAIDTRIEHASLLAHRPITAQVDTRSELSGSDDPFSRALWSEHQRRMADTLENLKSGTPVPKVAARDPFALRTVVGLLLFIGIAAGWGNWSSRIGDAFRNHIATAADAGGRIDAWVTPPAYTNRPPIFLNRVGVEKAKSVTVPEGSELVIRVLDLDKPSLALLTGDKEQDVSAEKTKSKETKADDKPARSTTYKTKLQQSASVQLRSGENNVDNWSFTVLPDANPTIAFEETPTSSTRGALEFSYKVEDDYGIASARAEIKSTIEGSTNAEPLIDAPDIQLPLPSRRAKEGIVKNSQDLTAHPWAGAEVTLTLIAEDEAGQTGRSETKTLVLPERIFTKPLARAIVEERRNLALDANAAPRVAEMLDIITDTHPDEFIKEFSVYISLRIAYRSIKRNTNKDELRDTLDLLWETALAIEDGDLSLAERRLRDAQERLAKALENGASDEEIAELMKELRQAMNEFLQELAEQMAKNPQNQQAMPMDPNAQVLRQQDIERMMQQIEDLAKSGSKDAARQLLEEMQRMMNNLQTAQPNQQQRNDPFSEQMNKLGEMMRQQQQLMDQTFDMQRRQQQMQQQGENGQKQQQNQQGQKQQQGEQSQPGGQKPMTPEEFAEAMKQLQQRQGELQKQMQGLQDSLKGLGMDPGKNLGEAGEAMGEAEGQLGQGDSGRATGEQGRALQAMREGAQQMMQNMQNQAGEQGRRGERGQHGQQSRQDRDPLGRPSRSEGPQLGNDTKVPGEIDAQRARKVLEAIRRKLGETFRPKLELDYLDRLLPLQ